MPTSYQPIAPITLQGFSQPVTALTFDPVSDTLWAGSNSGTISAYHTVRGIRGVSFPVGTSLAVSKIMVGDNYVRGFGVGSNALGSWAKGGVNKWNFRYAQRHSLSFGRHQYPSSSASNVTTFTGSGSHTVATANALPELSILNSMTGSLIRQAQVPAVVTSLEFTHSMLLSGSSDGYLRIHDSRTGLIRSGGEQHVRAHLGGVQGVQASGNFAFTIGLGER